MKKLVISFSLLFFFNTTFCSAAYYTIEMVKPIENESLKYEDDNIYISFLLPPKNPQCLVMFLYNKTDKVIEIDWANVSLVFEDTSYSVLIGTQFVTRIVGMKTTSTVPPKTRYEESIYLERNLDYINQPSVFTGGIGTYKSGWGGWLNIDDIFASNSTKIRMKPFFPTSVKGATKDKILDSTFGLFLPLAFEEVVNYSFTFKVENISAISPGFLGVLAADKDELQATNSKDTIETGVLLTRVFPKSPAKKSGFEIGDNIISINGVKINNNNDFVRLLNSKKEKDIIDITYIRNEKNIR